MKRRLLPFVVLVVCFVLGCLFVFQAYARQVTCPSCGGRGVIPGPVIHGIQSYYGCTQCGGSGGGGAPGSPGRGWIEVPDEPQANQSGNTEADRQAAEAERQRAIAEQQKKFQEEQKRAKEEFEKIKQEALNSMKGITGNDPGLKGVGSGDSLGLKGVGDSSANNLGLKGMDDSSLQLKDAVADSSVKTLFDKKRASQDLLSAHAHGITALDRAASILQGAASNPLLETSLEQAKAEADKRFGRKGDDAGQFDTVVLIGDSSFSQSSQNHTVHVPEQVARNLNYQKLVAERDALDHQIQQNQKEVESIKADPNYKQSSALLTKAYQLDNAIESLKVYKKFDDDRVTKMVRLEPVDFGDGNPPPPAQNNIDKIAVPSPAH